MTTDPLDRRHQILALSGGGFRGVFTAAFLARCEQEWAFDWHERFQLFAGTSVGALLAAGLAAGRSPADLLEAMKTHGKTIFPARLLHRPRRLFGGAPFRTAPLKAAAEQVLGEHKDTLLSEFPGRLVVTAVDYSRGKTILFASAGLAGNAASRVTIVDAILASAAAPTFFPMVKIGAYEFADGGLVANAPDLVALIEAMRHQRVEVDRSYMLSIGTASWSEGVVLRKKPGRPGIIGSVWGRKLVQTIMAAQEDLALQQMGVLLSDRHVRIDREPDRLRAAEIRDMDNASDKAFIALQQVANQAWDHWQTRQTLSDDHRLSDFFAR